MPNHKSAVVLTRAMPLDYTQDYVCLPASYGSSAYENRTDIQAIRQAVWENLLTLDAKIQFSARLCGRKVLIKPNLVTVFHNLGTLEKDYPQSTDPRVLDAVILFLQRYTNQISIVESSGRGMPTRASFHIAGLDRLAKLRDVQLIALEEQPVDRYLVPSAKVMREMVVPRVFSEVIRGEAFYISLPKLKTNLYTGVTLGFKNAMGVLTYNLRQRNHNHALEQKLVDMLHLFKPDLVILDGIIGGEGNCPAPVQPVESRIIISGNNSVETDRIAAKVMGFDPAQIPLIRCAEQDGFGDAHVEVIGEQPVIPFKPADASLFGVWMRQNFPLVRVLIGHSMPGSPLPDAQGQFAPEQLCQLGMVCRGGCLATVRYGFDMLYHEGQRRDFHLNLIIGTGVTTNDKVLYYDRDGSAYTVDHIRQLKGKKLTIGTCAQSLKPFVDRFVDGCMPYPNAPHMLLHQMSGTFCSVMSPKNKFLLPALWATMQVCEKRKALLRRGERLDIPLRHENALYPLRPLSQAESEQPYFLEPFALLNAQEIGQLCADEDRSILATFLP